MERMCDNVDKFVGCEILFKFCVWLRYDTTKGVGTMKWGWGMRSLELSWSGITSRWFSYTRKLYRVYRVSEVFVTNDFS